MDSAMETMALQAMSRIASCLHEYNSGTETLVYRKCVKCGASQCREENYEHYNEEASVK